MSKETLIVEEMDRRHSVPSARPSYSVLLLRKASFRSPNKIHSSNPDLRVLTVVKTVNNWMKSDGRQDANNNSKNSVSSDNHVGKQKIFSEIVQMKRTMYRNPFLNEEGEEMEWKPIPMRIIQNLV